jgi:cytochrome d ubiquinol oxidase subunit II
MTLATAAAGVMLLGLLAYALGAGADFGGGVWDLLARGPRAKAQRAAIAHALAPVWEANHVWLIFVVVVMFTAFAPAFARIGTELHVPLTVMLVGIVLRGSAFVFRQYGGDRGELRWGRVFAVSSTVAPWFLGAVLGAITSGGTWWSLFSLACGLLAIAAFAWLAATYLTVEVEDDALRAEFRTRAVVMAPVVAVMAGITALCAMRDAPSFYDALASSWWSVPVIGGATCTVAASALLARARRDRLARAGAIASVALIMLGWAVAHYPLLVAPDLTIASAAAPDATLRVLLAIVIVGACVLLPSLWWLLRVFKRARVT